MTYHLGIDLGATSTSAALCRPGAGTAEPVVLAGADAVASTLFLGADGVLLVGEAAERRALPDPARVVRGFVRRIGDATPVLVGGRPVPGEVLAAMFVAHLVREVSVREGEPPVRVAVAHPVGWGAHRVAALAAALAGQGVGPVLLLPGPQAAATGAAASVSGDGAAGAVAVYDLGGTSCAAAVVRARDGGGYEPVGVAETLDGFGGADIDDAVLAHVREAVGSAWDALDPADPAVLAAVAGLRRECTAAKEALSADTEVAIRVLLPAVHTTVRLTRAELEEMMRPAVLESVEALRRALGSAGVEAVGLDALLLVGGSSRIPLVAELVPAGIGLAAAAVDPARVVAAGAALAARAADVPAAAGGFGAGPGLGPVAPGPDARSADGRSAAVGSVGSVGSAGLGPVAPGRAAPGPAAAGPGSVALGDPEGEPEPTLAVALDRPAKQARPFAGAEPVPRSRSAVALALVAGLAATLLVGGAVAFAAARLGRGADAGAATPVTVATSVAPDPTPDPGTVRTQVVPPEPKRTTRPDRTRDTTPPATSAPPTTTAPPPTSAPPADPPTTSAPPPSSAPTGGAKAAATEGNGAAQPAAGGATPAPAGGGAPAGTAGA